MGKSDKDQRKKAKKWRKKMRRGVDEVDGVDFDDNTEEGVVNFEEDEDGKKKRVRAKKGVVRKLRGLCYQDPMKMIEDGDEVFSQDEYEGVEPAREQFDYPRVSLADRKRAAEGSGGEEDEQPAKKKRKRRSGGKTKAPKAGIQLSTEVKLPDGDTAKTDSTAGAKKGVSEEQREALAAAHGEEIAAYLVAEGMPHPTQVQEACWPPLRMGRDVLAVAPPGAGKTLAYVLPAAAALVKRHGQGKATRPEGPLCVVLVPTRELAHQVLASWQPCRRVHGLRTVAIFGGGDKEEQSDLLAREDPHVVVGTPGRLLDLASEGALSLAGTRILVVDEADKMMSQGLGEQLKKIRDMIPGGAAEEGGVKKEKAKGKGGRGEMARLQTALVSATMPDEVRAMAAQWLVNPVRVEVEVDRTLLSPTITQVVHVCAEHKKPKKLMKHMQNIEEKHKTQRVRPRVLVFANRIKTVRFLTREIAKAKFKVVALHGMRSQKERDDAMLAFRSGKVQVMVATDVAARGLHIRGLPYIINYDCPSNLEQYIHRVGRTGRLSSTGHAFTFITRSLARLSPALVELLREHGQAVDPNLQQLAKAWEEMSERLSDDQLRELEARQQAQEDKEAEQVAGEGEGEREGEREGEGEEEREAEQQGEMEKGGGRRGREGEEGREAGGRRHEGDILLVPVGPKGKARARPEGGLLEGGATGKVAIFADQREETEDVEAEAGPGSEGEEERDFIKSAKWAGSKKGFVFKTGPRGLGYYRDKGGAKGAAGAGKRQVEGGKKKLPGRLRKKLAKERGRG